MRPCFGSSAGCYSPWLPGERGTPLAPGGLGRRRRQPPSGPAGQLLRGSARLHGKRTDGPARARGAQTARLPACRWRVFRRANSASCDAQPTRLATRNRRVFRRVNSASCGAQPARLATRNRRVFRRASGASCGAHPARLPTRTQRVLRCAAGTPLWRAKYLHSEPDCFDSRFVAVKSIRLGRCLCSITAATDKYGRFFDIRGHALHENILQRQNRVGPLVSSKGKKAPLVPVINRRYTTRQPEFLFPQSVYTGFRLFVLLERRSGDVSTVPSGIKGNLVPWPNNSIGTQSCPPLAAAPPPRRGAELSRSRYVRSLESSGS